jgi:hypothetical protein
MFGLEAVRINPMDPGHRIVDRSEVLQGPKRKLTGEHNRTVSAVAVLFGDPQALRLDVYHNHFRHVPLSNCWYRSPLVRHFRLDRDSGLPYPDWVEI